MRPFNEWSVKNHGAFLAGLIAGMRCQIKDEVSKEYKVLVNDKFFGGINESGVYISVSDVDIINSLVYIRVWVYTDSYIDNIDIDIEYSGMNLIEYKSEEVYTNFIIDQNRISLSANIENNYTVLATLVYEVLDSNNSIRVVNATNVSYKDSKIIDFNTQVKEEELYKIGGIPEYGRQEVALGSSMIYRGYVYIPIWTVSKNIKRWRVVVDIPLNTEYRGVIKYSDIQVIDNIDNIVINIENNDIGVITAGILIFRVYDSNINVVIKLRSIIGIADEGNMINVAGSYGCIYSKNKLDYGLGGINITDQLKEVYTNDVSYVRLSGSIWSCTKQLIVIELKQSSRTVVQLYPGINNIDIMIPFLTHRTNTAITSGDIYLHYRDNLVINKTFVISIINKKVIENNSNLDNLLDIYSYTDFILFEKKRGGNGSFDIIDNIDYSELLEFFRRSAGTNAVDVFETTDFIEIEKIRIS